MPAHSPTWALRCAGPTSRAEARPCSQEALDLAERCGARAARRARPYGAARRRGPFERRREAAGWTQLTASERRVAELAAEGHSNPEIAQALFVTRKTVETHLGHVYRKLGISGGEARPALRGARRIAGG